MLRKFYKSYMSYVRLGLRYSYRQLNSQADADQGGYNFHFGKRGYAEKNNSDYLQE